MENKYLFGGSRVGTSRIDWKLLLQNRCPKCHRDLAVGLEETEGGCIDEMEDGDMTDKMLHHSCGFMISQRKWNTLVTKLSNRDYDGIPTPREIIFD